MPSTDSAPATPDRASRNLLTFCDGTGNELGRNRSNVFKLYRIAKKNRRHICYYHPGVGAISGISPWRGYRGSCAACLAWPLATGWTTTCNETAPALIDPSQSHTIRPQRPARHPAAATPSSIVNPAP